MQMRTWFGINAVVKIGPGWLHQAGFGRFRIPHPPLINWMLRRGLSEEAYRTLSFSHEFGHLQTAPLALIYTVMILIKTIVAGHTGWITIVFQLLSVHATWEIASEIYTMASTGQLYTDYYKGISLLPRVLFWILTIGLTATGWFVALR